MPFAGFRHLMFASAALTAAMAGAEDAAMVNKTGPWGELQVRVVYLEPPDNLLASVARPSAVTRWTFEQTTEQSVRESLARVGVPVAVRDRLFSPVRMVVSKNNLVLLPEAEDLLALSVETRSALYAQLASSEANEFQRDPVHILGGSVEDWLVDTGFSPKLQGLFRGLLWRRGKALAFSDIPALLAACDGSDEFVAVLRAVSRVRGLVAEIKLPLTTSRDDFIAYWSAGGRNDDRLPFITAMTRRRAPHTVDITQFLPTIPRGHIYSFPTASQLLRPRPPDCHWTSLNFFEDEPNDLYLDPAKASEHLLSDYVAIDPPLRLGDVLVFLDDGQGLHSCVHVAADIVMTKNGISSLAPWTLMTLQDLRDIYERSPATRIQAYRRKQ